MSIEAIASAAAAVAVSPYLASLTLTAPDRADRRWWRPRRAGAGRIAITAACAAVLALLAAAAARPAAALPAFLALALLGAVLVVVDVEHHRLPDRITLAVAVLGTAGLTAAAADGAWPDLTRAGLAAAAVFALFYGLALISPRGIGLGDVKLAGLLAGFLGWLGWASVIAGLAVGFAAAGALGILLLATRRATRRTHIPLGPFLIVAALAVAAYGVEPATDVVFQPLAPPPAATTATALDRLDRLPVLPGRPHPGGYDRGCRPGEGCVFGPAWTDDVDVAGGRNGCGTRDDVLAAQLDQVQLRAGSRCVVVSGVLHDPYTGEAITFAKATAGDVQIDHVVPLAMAWDLGAAGWDPERRREFANDPANLLAVDGAQNQAKGDQGPGEWLPPNRAFRCAYGALYIDISSRYGLPIAAGDAAALRALLARCP